MKINVLHKTIKAITALAMTFLIAGCAGHSKVIVASGYKKPEFAINASVAVIVLDQAPEIIYRGDALASLREVNANNEQNANTLIWNHFISSVVRDITKEADVTGAAVTTTQHRYLVSKEEVKTKEETVTVEIPDKKTRFTFDKQEFSHVLFLDRIRIGTETDPYYADRAEHGVYAGTARKLIMLTSFVLWDNRELKLVSYGRVKASEPISQKEATLQDWEDVSKDLVRQIFEATGFLKNRRR